jgi:hypothetical protein
MKPIDSNLQCPSCHAELRPSLLVCDTCEIRVEGPFRLNEFASLGPEDLHFLRIFVQSEGRIRDMEASLGLSYPTIRTRLTALKHRLSGAFLDSPPGGDEPNQPEGSDVSSAMPAGQAASPDSGDVAPALRAVLGELESGSISFEEALRRIRDTRTPRQGD